MHILFTGGGTMGPVTPLLAIAEELKSMQPDAKVSWIGTPNGPEGPLLSRRGFSFAALSAPKFDRTRPWKWPFLPLTMLTSSKRAGKLLREISPDWIVTAGAYVSVPLVIIGRLTGRKVWLHQLDVTPGLANRIMAPFATRISATWEESARRFPAKKTTVVGAMVRREIVDGSAAHAIERWHLRPHLPTVLVIGGGTGASSVNVAMATIASELVKEANVIHLTGKGKMLPELANLGEGYVAIEYLDAGLADAYAVADLVIARAGMGTIAELVALQKPAILLPIPGTQQEANVAAVQARGACETVDHLTPQTLLQKVRHLLRAQDRRAELGKAMGGLFSLNAAEEIVRGMMERGQV